MSASYADSSAGLVLALMSDHEVPAGMDADVFAMLPRDIQLELLASSTAVAPDTAATAPSSAKTTSKYLTKAHKLTVMTYNLWFKDLAMAARMSAAVDIIAERMPVFLSLQEVTQVMFDLLAPRLEALGYLLFPQSTVSYSYGVVLCSLVPIPEGVTAKRFGNSVMGREILMAETDMLVLLEGGSQAKLRVVVGTAHLESVTGKTERRSAERREQMVESFSRLNSARGDVKVFMGDMNWTDPVKRGNVYDGDVPIPSGWVDAWSSAEKCTAPNADGFTYDSVTNPMLLGKLRYRSDRVYVWANQAPFSATVEQATVIGTQALPGITDTWTSPYNGEVRRLPVLPSDHFSLSVSIDILTSEPEAATSAPARTAAAVPSALKATASAPAASKKRSRPPADVKDKSASGVIDLCSD